MDLQVLTGPVILIAVLVVLALAFWARYKTVGAEKAMIITGSFLGGRHIASDDNGRRLKIIRGGGSFILPIFQQYEFISLNSHKLEIKTPEVYTKQGVPVMADGIAIVKIDGTIEGISTAAEQFMGKSTEDLQNEAREVLEGHLRAILGAMTVEEIYQKRDVFSTKVLEVSQTDLDKMGLRIVSFNIRDVRDKNGYLEALGQPQIAAVKRDAEIAKANADRDARVKRASADQEAQKAELERDTLVAESEKNKAMSVAQFKKEQDVAKAEADQAYSIQEARSKRIVMEEQMQVEIVKRERESDIKMKEIEIREREFAAEIVKKAEAERSAVIQAAEADKERRILQADANKYVIETQAAAERSKGTAEADVSRAKGTAEADIIRLQGFAEAEAKEKLAAAFEKFGQAAILEMIVKMLPELAGKIAEPMGHIEKITVLDAGGNGGGATKVSKYLTELMATAPDMLKSVSGIDLERLINGFVLKGSADVSPVTEIKTE
ncbi:flotillin family protein [Cohnella suwonensis]|uniref:Flotillin family protein n=1 Tax=Cohnella suwonensis TaxID=696072 RepID=A0ABW0LWG7_9BACL